MSANQMTFSLISETQLGSTEKKSPTKPKARFVARRRVIWIDGKSYRIPTDALELDRFLKWLTKECQQLWDSANATDREKLLAFMRQVESRM